jgi:hypothetical protein
MQLPCSKTKDTIPRDSIMYHALKEWEYDKRKMIEKSNKIALKIMKQRLLGKKGDLIAKKR